MLWIMMYVSFCKLSMSYHTQLFPSISATHTFVGNGDDHSYEHWIIRVKWFPAYRCGHRPALFSTSIGSLQPNVKQRMK